MKMERVSYDVMTPSAARGILEAIYWKPSIRWVVDRIHILRAPRWIQFRRNEIKSKSPRNGLPMYITDKRTQRTTLALRDVDYLIEGHFQTLVSEPNPGKHINMFRRRAKAGQSFNQPYLGCREFSAQFTWWEGDPPESELQGKRDLGWILRDIEFEADMAPQFFRAEMVDGVIEVPQEMEKVRM
jgi:CRISPR-associated protein Cas5d